MAYALRNMGLPGLLLWAALLPHVPRLLCHEDNQPMIRVIQTGKNPTMRYLMRTHRISVAWLYERFQQGDLKLVYEESAKMCADIYTKAFTDVKKWNEVRDLIGIFDTDTLKQL